MTKNKYDFAENNGFSEREADLLNSLLLVDGDGRLFYKTVTCYATRTVALASAANRSTQKNAVRMRSVSEYLSMEFEDKPDMVLTFANFFQGYTPH